MSDLQLAVALRKAKSALEAGELGHAEAMCRQILARKPRSPEALVPTLSFQISSSEAMTLSM